jgi:hypothetical protein
MPPKEDPSSGHLIDPIQTPEKASSIPTKRIQLSDVAMAKSAHQKRQQDLWWIHGNGYDLDSFVERHPGGKEAILLGKGRDCTALVESYHAFSSQHNRILEKYLYKQAEGKKQDPDFFYECLKQRVAAVLKARGMDPVEDRGASWLRILYYLVIVLAVLATGYVHVKVSFFQNGSDGVLFTVSISDR